MNDPKQGQKVALVIGCGKQKIWRQHPRLGPVAAGVAYTGALFQASRRYAERFYRDNWFILSAHFGLLHPATQIMDYDTTFGQNGDAVIPIAKLQRQCEAMLGRYDWVISLASQAYNQQLSQSLRKGQSLEIPLASVGLFDRMKWLRRAVSTNRK
jgi:hypothetical protein